MVGKPEVGSEWVDTSGLPQTGGNSRLVQSLDALLVGFYWGRNLALWETYGQDSTLRPGRGRTVAPEKPIAILCRDAVMNCRLLLRSRMVKHKLPVIRRERSQASPIRMAGHPRLRGAATPFVTAVRLAAQVALAPAQMAPRPPASYHRPH